MLESTAFLLTYARVLRRLTGSEAVSVYLPAAPGGSPAALLLNTEDRPAVPELADLAEEEDAAEPVPSSSLPRRRVPSREPGGWLLPVTEEAADTPTVVLGLRWTPGAGGRATEMPLPVLPGGSAEAWERLWALGADLAAQYQRVEAVLRDPVTGLPGRADFQAMLHRAVESTRRRGRGLSLVLVNPDDFPAVNERLGSSAGDAVIRELGDRLRASVGGRALVHRYGAVVFAVTFAETDIEEARRAAERLHGELTAGAYHRGALRLGFHLGLAALDPATPEAPADAALELFRRADGALARARLPGRGPLGVWEPDAAEVVKVHQDRLTGIFTADQAKDYRNMLLLWDMVNLVAAGTPSDELASRAVDRLDTAFRPDRIGLFTRSEDGELRLLAGRRRSGSRPGDAGSLVLDPSEQAMLARAQEAGKLVQEHLEGIGDAYAVPLLARGESLGCLYLAGRDPSLRLDASDLHFLEALGGQLEAALDRIRLVERERRRQMQERRRLEAELEELREAARQARLVYRSPQMEAVLDTLRRVAPTDATVLITGPSGTGKEVVARTLHELSRRRGRPLVVVDCGAISASLIDSELFGHERGAFTGAAQRTVGRLAEADGGTLILDEIGELPLEVQSKLLRFVQDKQLTPVGGVRPRTVDVRLIAVTHRDLRREVAAGRFREDLYYRLNVVRVEIPPLAERPEDAAALVEHFLATFSRRYGKAIRGLTAEAEARIRAHTWPGNVRELQNRLLQAVILCEGEELGPRELGLVTGAVPSRPPDTTATEAGGDPPPAPPLTRRPPETAPAAEPPRLSPEAAWEALRTGLRRQIEAALAAGAAPPPLGRWLAEDLVRTADGVTAGVASRAATRLGIPETTYRRRRRAVAEVVPSRSPAFEELRRPIEDLVRAAPFPGDDLLDRTRRILLEEVTSRLPRDPTVAAALLGVTTRTLRRWQEALQEPSPEKG